MKRSAAIFSSIVCKRHSEHFLCYILLATFCSDACINVCTSKKLLKLSVMNGISSESINVIETSWYKI
jgi:hypothetical protein